MPRRPTARLSLHRLEDRATPTVMIPEREILVTAAADVVDPNDGVMSLREAIADAHTPASDGMQYRGRPVIRFAPELAGATITVSQVGGTTLGPAAFEITDGVRIAGSGQKIVRAADAPEMRLFNVLGDLPKLPSAILPTWLSLEEVELLNWRSDGFGGAIYSRNAGVRISTSTLAGNSAATLGGAVYAVGGWVSVNTSTFTGNTARPDANGYSAGGAILVGPGDADGTLILIASTLADNAAVSGAQVFAAGPAAVTIDQSILYTAPAAGWRHDLVVQAPPSTVGFQGERNLIGSAFGFAGGVVSSADPLLGPLQDNGGPTRTMALLPGSPAVNAGRVRTEFTPNWADQRGAVRDGFDLGAFEFGTTAPPPNAPPVLPTTPPVVVPSLATGAAAGQPPEVVAYDLDGNELTRFLAFAPDFLGGVNVALADLTADGVPDILAAAGAGGGPHVRVFDGRTYSEVASFFAYDPSFAGGVSVAAGDVTGDGVLDIVTGAGPGAGPHVKAFDGRTRAEVRSFYAYAPEFRGGVSVAVLSATVSGDGTFVRAGQIVTGAGPGGGPHVKAFTTDTLQEVQSFFAYDANFSGGVSVGVLAGGEIVTGAGPGGGPHLKLFVQNEFYQRGEPGVTEESGLFTEAADDTGGVRVSVDGSNRVVVLTRTADDRVSAKRYRFVYGLRPVVGGLTVSLGEDDSPGTFPAAVGEVGSTIGRTFGFTPSPVAYFPPHPGFLV